MPRALLDGDDVRAVIRPSYGYDDQARTDFTLRLRGLRRCWPNKVLSCWFQRRQIAKNTAIPPAVWPSLCRSLRRHTASRMPASRSQGLYKQAPSTLPGGGTSYEVPEHPDLTVRVGDKGSKTCSRCFCKTERKRYGVAFLMILKSVRRFSSRPSGFCCQRRVHRVHCRWR